MRKALLASLVACTLLAAPSCTTRALWENTNPHERIWIDASRTSEADLQRRGVRYEVYESQLGRGYLLDKNGWQKMKDYHLRALGTPVTLVVDAASTVVIVGVLLFLEDPQGTVTLIDALCH